RVGGRYRLRHAHRIRVRLPVLADPASKEVGHCVAGELAREGVSANGPRIRDGIGLRPQVVSAEAELMGSSYDGEVIARAGVLHLRIRVRVERAAADA